MKADIWDIMSLHKNVTYILLEIKHVRKCSMSLLLIPNIGNMNDVIWPIKNGCTYSRALYKYLQ